MLDWMGHLSPIQQRVILIGLCVVLYAVWLTYVPLTDIDETRYTEATREMREAGNFIIPQFNYEPRYQKPIFYYWVQSASISLFGQRESAARLPSALGATLLVLLLHAFLLCHLPQYTDTRRGRGAAMMGALALATTPLIAYWARSAVTDITLTLFTSCALLAILHASMLSMESAEAKRFWDRPGPWYMIASASCGLAFLTKGPIGIVIPGLVWLAFHLRNSTLRRAAKDVPWFACAALFIGIAAPWYIATYFVDGPGFLRHFFLRENLQRFSGGGGGFTGQSLLNFIGFFLLSLLLLFPYAGSVAREWLFPFSGDEGLRKNVKLMLLRRFALIWIAVPLGLVIISSTRHPNYVQSICAGMGMVIALSVLGRSRLAGNEGLCSRGLSRARVGNVVEATFFLFPLVAWSAGIGYMLLQGKAGVRAWEMVMPLGAVMWISVLLALCVMLLIRAFILRRKDGALFLPGVLAGWIPTLVVCLLGLAPVLIRGMYTPLVEAGTFIKGLPKNYTVVNLLDYEAETLVYYGQRKVLFRKLSKGVASFPPSSRLIVVTNEEGDRLLRDKAGYRRLFSNSYFRISQITTAPKKKRSDSDVNVMESPVRRE